MFLWVGTKDYSTGLVDSNSLGFGGTGFANSADVSSFYALKTTVWQPVGSYVNSDANYTNSTYVGSFYALKTTTWATSTWVGSGYQPIGSYVNSDANYTNSTYVGSFYALKTTTWATSTWVGSNYQPLGASGIWTPTDASGAGLTFTGTAHYIQFGKTCFVFGFLSCSSNASAAQMQIGGLPFTVSSLGINGFPLPVDCQAAGQSAFWFFNVNSTTAGLGSFVTAQALSNSMNSGQGTYFACTYPTN